MFSGAVRGNKIFRFLSIFFRCVGLVFVLVLECDRGGPCNVIVFYIPRADSHLERKSRFHGVTAFLRYSIIEREALHFDLELMNEAVYMSV